jgi:prepilin-type N-terminal cleavage/methylation domain-containing protein
MKTKNGFTLLELLVVIGIVGVLLSLVTVGFSKAQTQGRNTRRRQDLAAIQNALEQYYANNSFTYPNGCAAGAGLSTYFTGGVIPTDPVSTKSYTWNCTTSTYTITATLDPSGTIQVNQLQ